MNSLKAKTIVLVSAILVGLLLMTYVALSALKIASDADNKARVGQLFKSTYSTVLSLEKLQQSGVLTLAEAQRIATQLLRKNVYHESEYVYVVDNQLNFVAAPLDPQLHNSSFHEFKDSQGQSVGQVMLDALAKQTSEHELAEYTWQQLKADGSIENKLSIVQKSPLWGWYIGTGIGFDEVNQRFWNTASWLLTICLALVFVLAGALIWTFRNLLALIGGEPKVVFSQVHSVSKGNLREQAGEQLCTEQDSILAATYFMKSKLRSMVENLQNLAANLASQTQDSENRSKQIELSLNSQQQQIDLVVTAITQMSATSESVAENTNQAAEAANLASEQSDVVIDIVGNSVNKMQALTQQLQASDAVVNKLGQDVQSIGVVLDVIREIAEQTNLLALNAAIEAARAGEEGRGFAVVADEVRHLAKRTQDSTSEIQTMIDTLRQGAKSGVESMQSCIVAADDAVNTVSETHLSLHGIAKAVDTINQMNNQIASAAEEQSIVCDDIMNSVHRIADTAHTVTQASHENQSATQALVGLTTQVKSNLDFFSR
ncbi:methyl-accepting chemotaxis protein [Catenovulum sp. SX2]|uniref:methyl-accepting chemotaxis protein n=1 Tax=Catenovulum sp. SX2 TaxID=3398614 RepID=UPI003F87A407